MMFNIFAANPDLRGSKHQEEARVDFEDFTTKYDGFYLKSNTLIIEMPQI